MGPGPELLRALSAVLLGPEESVTQTEVLVSLPRLPVSL